MVPAVRARMSPVKGGLHPGPLRVGLTVDIVLLRFFGHVLHYLSLCVYTHYEKLYLFLLIFQFRFSEDYFARMIKLEDANSTWSTSTGVPITLDFPLMQSSVLPDRQTDASLLALISRPLIYMQFELGKSVGSFVNGSRAWESLHTTWAALVCPGLAGSACSNLVPSERSWYQIFLTKCVWYVSWL